MFNYEDGENIKDKNFQSKEMIIKKITTTTTLPIKDDGGSEVNIQVLKMNLITY